mmetsp:Transcript_70667/g.159860  ORF Transcript_70667/g.159860 Transcript_70667/m.159860 type:complete len:447 (-) Transcript_70667:1652-2992(-)
MYGDQIRRGVGQGLDALRALLPPGLALQQAHVLHPRLPRRAPPPQRQVEDGEDLPRLGLGGALGGGRHLVQQEARAPADRPREAELVALERLVLQRRRHRVGRVRRAEPLLGEGGRGHRGEERGVDPAADPARVQVDQGARRQDRVARAGLGADLQRGEQAVLPHAPRLPAALGTLGERGQGQVGALEAEVDRAHVAPGVPGVGHVSHHRAEGGERGLPLLEAHAHGPEHEPVRGVARLQLQRLAQQVLGPLELAPRVCQVRRLGRRVPGPLLGGTVGLLAQLAPLLGRLRRARVRQVHRLPAQAARRFREPAAATGPGGLVVRCGLGRGVEVAESAEHPRRGGAWLVEVVAAELGGHEGQGLRLLAHARVAVEGVVPELELLIQLRGAHQHAELHVAAGQVLLELPAGRVDHRVHELEPLTRGGAVLHGVEAHLGEREGGGVLVH